MASQNPTKQPLTLLRTSFNTLIAHPQIIFPYLCLAFIQLLALEFIFFAPRYPLSIFFEPIITRVESPVFLHYPYNYDLMLRWFQKVQLPIQLFLGSFVVGATVLCIDLINRDATVKLMAVFRKTLRSYLHLFVLFLLIITLTYGFSFLYTKFIVGRAVQIRSTTGMFFFLKQFVILGKPFINLLFAVFVNIIFAYVVPLVVLEQKKIFSAIVLNFAYLWRNLWVTTVVIFLPSLLYLVIFALQSNSKTLMNILAPEVWAIFLVISVAINLIVDLVQYTAVTTLFLISKEQK